MVVTGVEEEEAEELGGGGGGGEGTKNGQRELGVKWEPII